MENKLLITPDTKIFDLLKEYPDLENKLIEIAPVFSKLKNPLLRNTIAKVTSVRQAAVVGNVSLSKLITDLRKETGQEEFTEDLKSVSKSNSKPVWIDSFTKKEEYNAIEDIDKGIHPIGKVMKEAASLSNEEYYLLITNFVPQPLIDALINKGFIVFTANIKSGNTGTYIRKT